MSNTDKKKNKTWNAISTLLQEVREQTKMTSIRQGLQRLHATLRQPATRLGLAMEVPSFRALQSVWELVVNTSIQASRQIDRKRKEGMAMEDITMTFQLIQLADNKKHADEVYATAISHPVTPQEFSRFRDAFLIGHKEARSVLAYCLDLLNDDRACEKAENYILRMLAGMLSQTGYVSALRSDSQMQSILEEVERRILVAEDEQVQIPYDVQVTAAEIFRNLLRTSTDLGMDFPALVASSIKMVAAWCTEIVAEEDVKNSVQNVFLPLLEGVCCLIRINPEQACEPLRRHGRVILRCAKKVYRKALDRQNRDIVHEYFLCHLYVSFTVVSVVGW